MDYEVIRTIINHGFIDTELAGRQDNYKFTGSFPTDVEKPGDHGDNRRLDYVFVSPSLRDYIFSSQIIVNEQTLFFSDHLPVLIDINTERKK